MGAVLLLSADITAHVVFSEAGDSQAKEKRLPLDSSPNLFLD